MDGLLITFFPALNPRPDYLNTSSRANRLLITFFPALNPRPDYLNTDCDSNSFSSSDNDSNSLRFSSVSSYGSPIAHSSPCTTQPESPLREKIKVRNKNNNLRAIVINFQSLKNKKTDLQLTTDNANPDIIFGCETWLHKKIYTIEILPNNYTVYRKY